MGVFRKLFTVLAKIALDKIIGEKRTDELVGVIRDFRAVPSPAAEQNEGPELAFALREAVADATKSDPEGKQRAEEQAKAELLLTDVFAELPLEELADPAIPPEEIAKKLLEALPNEVAGVYLLWLNLPDGGCYCHFSWGWNEKAKRTTFRIRDYVHRKLYYCVTKPDNEEVRESKWEVQDWNDRTALELWHSAQRQVRCRGAFLLDRMKFSTWKNTLDEMTRSLAP